MPGCCVQRWSLSLGRWWGVSVYLHIFFLLSALLALPFTLADSELMVAGILAVSVLLVSVALHELAHALAAVRVGGKVDAIVLGPVGGLISPRVPDEPEVHLFVALFGPLVHLLLAVAAAVVLAVVGNTELVGLLNPLATPRDLLVEPGSALAGSRQIDAVAQLDFDAPEFASHLSLRRRPDPPRHVVAGAGPANGPSRYGAGRHGGRRADLCGIASYAAQ